MHIQNLWLQKQNKNPVWFWFCIFWKPKLILSNGFMKRNIKGVNYLETCITRKGVNYFDFNIIRGAEDQNFKSISSEAWGEWDIQHKIQLWSYRGIVIKSSRTHKNTIDYKIIGALQLQLFEKHAMHRTWLEIRINTQSISWF